MTTFIPSLLAGFLLGVLATLLYLLRQPRPPVTMHERRKYRDRPERVGGLPHTRMPPPPMPVCKPARDAEVGGIEYRFMGATGLEE